MIIKFVPYSYFKKRKELEDLALFYFPLYFAEII